MNNRTVKSLVKSTLKAIAPQRYHALMAARENRHGQRVMEQHGIPEIASLFTERYGTTILGGPFQGMAYISQSTGSTYLPKLIGCYENELKGAMDHALTRRYETVVDVGCAEGFYAVGLAMRLPGSPKVYAFDTDREAQTLCRELAHRNRVEDKVVVEGYCDPPLLQSTLKGKSLILCDCEGYEVELLQPTLVPALAEADIIVELHDVFKPGLTRIICERFQASHGIQIIDSQQRNPSDYPVLQFLPPEQQEAAVSEFRHGPQQWAFMTPKA